MKAVPMNTRNPQGELLHKAKEFLVKYELTNKLDTSVAVNVDNTPLDLHELKENLVAESVGVYYYGVSMERSGAKQRRFGSFINIAPGETVTHIFDLGRYLLVDHVEEIKLNFIHSLQWHIVGDEDNVKDEPFLSNTLTIPVKHTKFVEVDLGDRITSGSNGNGTRHLEGKELDAALHRNLAIKFTGSGDTHPNVPHFVYECSDVKSTGHVFPDGQKLTCSDVAQLGGCEKYGWMCLKSCDMCGKATDTFTKPYVAKSYKTQNCNAEQKKALQKAEEMKTAICKDILYELFHKTNHQVTTSFKAILERWIGESTERTVTVLQEGFSRMCSLQDYIYECDPEDCEYSVDSCVKDGKALTPVYTGQQKVEFPHKEAMRKCVSEGGIEPEPSLTLAWVFPGVTKPKRIINLCQVGFWNVPEQVRATTWTDGFFDGSSGALLIHELSHFVDMVNTDDLQYAVSKMIAAAKATPFKYVRNAASWANLADDPDNIRRSWGDFKSNAPPAHVQESVNTNVCRTGYEKIMSTTECDAAATALDLKTSESQTETASDYPSGCYLYNEDGLFVNLDTSNTKDSGSSPICKIIR